MRYSSEGRNILLELATIPKSAFSRVDVLLNGRSESNNPFAQTRWLFAVISSRKYKKCVNCEILITITPEVNMVSRQMTPFLSTILWALFVGIFHFRIPRPSKL